MAERTTLCLHPDGCWQPAKKKHLCDDHMWEGADWTREKATLQDGTEFTYLALKVISPPMIVDDDALKRAAIEEEFLLKKERS